MTKEERDEILSYVAQNFISPLCFDDRPANEVYLEMSGDKFNDFVEFMYDIEKRGKQK